MATELHVEELDDTAYPHWNRLVAGSPAGSIYSTPEYLDTLCRTAGGSFRIMAVYRADEMIGGIGLYVCTAPYGSYITPRLLLYYNGLVVKSYDGTYPSKKTSFETRALAALGERLSAAGYASVNIRSRSPIRDVRPLLSQGWSATPSYSYVVPLDDMKAAWSRVEQNLRRLIGRCEDDGMEISSDSEFSDFYDLHRRTLDRKGAGHYLAREAFLRYFEILEQQELCQLFHVREPNGRLIASQLVLLGAHPVTHTVAAATDPEFMKTGVSAFLRWKTFEALAARGYSGNDLTDAELNPVTHFKAQLGGHLDLNIVLDSPRTRTFRVGVATSNLALRARGLAGHCVRWALGRR